MVAVRKYPDELRERAIRMVEPAVIRIHPRGVIARIAEQLGINRETLRNGVSRAGIEAAMAPVTITRPGQRPVELEREVRELCRANAILRSPLTFFAVGLDRPHTM